MALTRHEFGQLRPHDGADILTPVDGNTRAGVASLLTHAPMRRNQGPRSAATSAQLAPQWPLQALDTIDFACPTTQRSPATHTVPAFLPAVTPSARDRCKACN